MYSAQPEAVTSEHSAAAVKTLPSPAQARKTVCKPVAALTVDEVERQLPVVHCQRAGAGAPHALCVDRVGAARRIQHDQISPENVAGSLLEKDFRVQIERASPSYRKWNCVHSPELRLIRALSFSSSGVVPRSSTAWG